jgi:hypothetical protein
MYKGSGTPMKRLIIAYAALACLFAPAAIAQNATPVPILKAPYHLPVFKNEFVTLLNIYIPPGHNTGYHIHDRPSLSVTVEASEMVNQTFGAPKPDPVQPAQLGRINYVDYRKKIRIHSEGNVGTTPFHNVSFIFNLDQPSGFIPSSRAEVPGYVQVIDNDRVRGWRVALEPGQSVASITQQAPGIRIFLSAGDLVESVPGQPDRAMHGKLGEFYWQDPGVTRGIRNTGTTRLEFMEFELK